MPEAKSQQKISGASTSLDSAKNGVSSKKTAQQLLGWALGCRHEIKYLISESKAQAIAQFIQPYLPQDRYCKLQQRGAYPIVSLYLDSDNLQLCRESLTGQKSRFKLRIRSYTDEPDYPCFFEIKRRLNAVIMKSRARVVQGDIPTLLSGMSLPPQEYSVDEKTLQQFQLYMKSINARPVILIRYLRQAFESNTENRIRVTLDRELYYKVTRVPELTLNDSGWQPHSYTLGNVILEVKFTGHYPAWLYRMVECFDLRQESISKYATSIMQSYKLGFCAPHLEAREYG